MKVNTSLAAIAGKLAAITDKPGRAEKSTDILMRDRITTIKSGKETGQMKMLLRGVSDHGPKALRNIFLGRSPATKEDIAKVMQTQHMTPEEIKTVLSNIKSDNKGRFQAIAVKNEIDNVIKNRPVRSEDSGKFFAGKDGTSDLALRLNQGSMNAVQEDYIYTLDNPFQSPAK
jgi:hypothetical protein